MSEDGATARKESTPRAGLLLAIAALDPLRVRSTAAGENASADAVQRGVRSSFFSRAGFGPAPSVLCQRVRACAAAAAAFP